MPTVKIPVKRFRENYMAPNEQGFLRVFGPALLARGFRLKEVQMSVKTTGWQADPPLQLDRGTEFLAVSQDVPGRIANNDGRFQECLRAIKFGQAEAVMTLYSLLMAEGDDRAETLLALEVSDSWVGQDVPYYDDTGTSGEGHSETVVSGKKVFERQLCDKVLLLFGVKEVPL